ncbi:c-type cytochrome [Melghirimyces algeriensis]|uniref:Cytochrome c551 n=1 Tax=Melghirimyces algeriensis TaxID=910412 RepID=A0A521D362_9BACL|nr:cytochrome c [Melghirimyces algeriensis]SMO66135.1 cytochrome c551 [Melghirimyces algeriensis]
MNWKWGISVGVGLLLLAACAPQDEPPKGETEEASPKTLYSNNCAGCHGRNLEGTAGPSLEKVGEKYSQSEIEQILANGKGQMPAQKRLSDEQRDKLASWLAEKK